MASSEVHGPRHMMTIFVDVRDVSGSRAEQSIRNRVIVGARLKNENWDLTGVKVKKNVKLGSNRCDGEKGKELAWMGVGIKTKQRF